MNRKRKNTPAALRLVAGLFVLICIGTGLFMLPVMGATRPLTFMEALFTATSALTVTGLSTINAYSDLSLIGKTLLLVLIQLGGVGFMVAVVVLLRLLGRRVLLNDRIALQDALGVVLPGGIVQLVKQMLVVSITVEALGAVLLFLHWRQWLPPLEAAGYAIFHAVSAFCNAGFDLFTGRPDFPAGLPNDNLTLTIMGTLIFIGALGFPVVGEVVNLARYAREARIEKVSLHTRITLVMVVGLVLLGGLGLLISESRAGGVMAEEPIGRRVVLSLFQSVSTRTAGFSVVSDFEQFNPASRLILMAFMFVGSAPASMGGGITTGTLAVLLLALWGYANGYENPVIAGRQLAQGTIRRAAAVLTVSITLVGVVSWLILMTHETTLDRAVFEVISAFATCGLSLAFTTQLNPFGQALIIFVMFWGRLGALTIVLAITQQQAGRSTHLVTYPEEQVLIG